MDKSPPENLRVRRKRVITGLLKGKEFAAQLQALLRKSNRADSSGLATELTLEIGRSFTQAIFELKSCGGTPQISQIPAAASACLKPEDSGKNKKVRRGRYNKRKNSESWTKVSKTKEDGGAWRKYGQKNILHSEYPRCYFRCTHKFGQGCKATKQVQRTIDGLYQTTYIGHHTCENPRLKILNFSDNNNVPNYHQSMLEASHDDEGNDNGDDNGTIVTVMKKEDEEEETAQSVVSESQALPDDNNNYGDECNNIWGDIMGQFSNSTSLYACSSTSFVNDVDMENVAEFGTLFPLDDDEHILP